MNKILYFLMYLYIFVLALLPSKFKLGPLPVNGDVFIVLIIMFYIICIIVVKEMRKKFIDGFIKLPKDYTLIFFILYICVMFFSISYASDVKLALKESIRASTYLALIFIIKNEISDIRIIKNLLGCTIVTIVIICIFGIISFILGINVEVVYGLNRIEGTFENSNNFAMFLVLLVFPIIMLAINLKKNRMVYISISILMIMNIVLTVSRNAMLGFGIGCILLILMVSWKLIIFIGGMGVVSAFIPRIRERVLQIDSYNQNLSRIKLWKVAVDIIKDYPLKGVGNGNYSTYYKFYEYKYTNTNYKPESNVHPHNILLKVQSELGVLGLFSFLGLIICCLYYIRKLIIFVKDSYVKAFYKGFFISFIVFMMMNMIDNFFSAPKVVTFFWMLIAISQSIAFKTDFEENNSLT